MKDFKPELEQRLALIPQSAQLRFVPVRHHSPACAQHLKTLIARDQPEIILIEGPSDISSLIHYLGDKDAKPPLAFYCYSVNEEEDIRSRCFYPMAEFSPEWVAIRAGLKQGAEVRFIDLPYGSRITAGRDPSADSGDQEASLLGEQSLIDPSARLIELSDCRDFNEWWDRYFESAAMQVDPEDYFRNLLSGCLLLRDAEQTVNSENQAREIYMAAHIRAAINEGKRCLVITGGFHTETLARYLREPTPEFEPALVESKDEPSVYLVPYTLNRLDSANDYAAGMPHSSYYSTVWKHYKQQPEHAHQQAGTDLALEVSRMMGSSGYSVSMPDCIEAVTLSRRLAALRSTAVGRSEILDAMTTAFCKHSEQNVAHEIAAVLAQLSNSTTPGQVPKRYPCAPLVADFRQQCAHYKLPLSAMSPQEKSLDIYRSERHREISRLLHQLHFLEVPYAEWRAGPDFINGDELGRVREIWDLNWSPNTEAHLTECMAYGAQLAEASLNRLLDQLEAQNSDAPALLLQALRMGLHTLVDWILPHIEYWLASENALPALVHGLTRLHMAYAARTALGVVGLEAMQPLLAACFERACLRLTWLGQMDAEHGNACADALADLNGLARAEVDWIDLPLFQHCVEALYDSPAAMVLRGRAAAILSVRQIWTIEQTLEALTEALNQASLQPELLSEFLSGFLPLARSYLLQSPDLLASLGEVIIAWDEDTFLQALPALRLAFTVLKPRETQALAKLIAQQSGGVDLMLDDLIVWSTEELKQLQGLHTDVENALAKWGFSKTA